MTDNIKWGKNLSEALEKAGKEDKLVLLDFFSPT